MYVGENTEYSIPSAIVFGYFKKQHHTSLKTKWKHQQK